MVLTPGARLGLYEIAAPIGRGGMGEVYRALDTSLGRQVAIKVLPETFAHDPERLARFDREAKTLAALNHSNIAQIYGFERTGAVRALVMELVEGPTLADRIAEGPIPLEEALQIARQVVDALEAAHEQGIIHRDLKPANIKLRADGTVKVLDFGLAKALETASADSIDPATATLTSPTMLSAAGVLLGTAAYMSPEQARGKPVDRRADVWAFGCVLYEMLTGRRAFDGEDVSLILSQVLQRDPAFNSLPGGVPARIEQMLRLCLKKPLKERLTDIGSVRLMLDGAFDVASAQPVRRGRIPLPVALAVAAAVGGIAVWRLMPDAAPSPRPVVRFSLPASTSLAPRGSGIGRHVLAISPRGTHVVLWADDKLVLRSLDRLEDVPIRGTERAREPFFSADGRWIGFHQDRQFKRVSLDGGAPVPIGDSANPWGARWDTDGLIRFGQGSEGIWQVSPSGGAPSRVIAVAPGEAAHGPQLLPDGEWVLFTLRPPSEASWDRARIVAQSLVSGERIVLIENGRDARYVSTGHLVYGLNGVLLAVPFDARARRVTGASVALVEGVMDSDVRTGAMHFGVSDDGTLAYLAGASGQRSALTLVNRSGRREPVSSEPLPYSSPRVSPDGTRVAVEVPVRNGVDIHVYDLARRTLTRLPTSSVYARFPLWTQDSRRIVFYSDAAGGGLYSIAADGVGAPARLTSSREFQVPYSWADGGQTLLIDQRSADRLAAGDIFVLHLPGETAAKPLVQTAAEEGQPVISPNGRWLAYSAGQDRQRSDVFVRPFPQVNDRQWQISTDGGDAPLWSRDGKQLFFISNGRAMSVPIEMIPDFRPGNPAVMFELPPFYKSSARTGRDWDIAPDGERFLILSPGDSADESAHSHFVVVLNWYEELRRLVKSQERAR